MKRMLPAAALATAVWIALATAALAHPSFNPDELPAGEPTPTTLVIAHGCTPSGADHDAQDVSPTVEIRMQVPEELDVVGAPETAGWTVETREESGRVVEVAWLDDGGATTEPITLELILTPRAAARTTVYVPVFQRCQEGQISWLGTPEREAESPAAVIDVVTGTSVGETDTPTDSPGVPTDVSIDDPRDQDDPTPQATEVADEDASGDNGFPWVAGLVALALTAGLAAGVAAARRRGGG